MRCDCRRANFAAAALPKRDPQGARPMLKSRALLLALFTAGLAATHLHAQPAPAQLSVQGEGYVEATPDLVIVDVTVSHTGKTLAEAKQQVDSIGNAVIRAADLHGIKNDDLQASKIQAAPEYDWNNGQRVLRGQQVTRQFELTLRDIDRYGALIQALADAEVTQINSTRMEFSKQEQLDNAALRKAIANARAKAQEMAAAFDTRIKGVLNASESGGPGQPRPYEMRADFAKARTASGDGGAALQIGKQRIVKSVNAVFELEGSR
jgi:uncharacterized protein YggE